MTAVNPSPINDIKTAEIENVKSKTQLKEEAKLKRKAKRLQKKISKLTESDEVKKKGRVLIIIGAVLLIIGILVLLAPTAGGLAGCLEALVALIFGVGLSIGGAVTMIIGIVQAS